MVQKTSDPVDNKKNIRCSSGLNPIKFQKFKAHFQSFFLLYINKEQISHDTITSGSMI